MLQSLCKTIFACVFSASDTEWTEITWNRQNSCKIATEDTNSVSHNRVSDSLNLDSDSLNPDSVSLNSDCVILTTPPPPIVTQWRHLPEGMLQRSWPTSQGRTLVPLRARSSVAPRRTPGDAGASCRVGNPTRTASPPGDNKLPYKCNAHVEIYKTIITGDNICMTLQSVQVVHPGAECSIYTDKNSKKKSHR